MRRPLRLRLAASGAALLLATGLAGCGDDDDDETTAATTTTEAEAGEEAKLAATCEAQVDLAKGFDAFFSSLPEVEGEGPPPPEVIAQVQQSYDQNLAPPLAEFEANAPGSIREDVDKGLEIFRKFREQPDPAILEDPEFEAIGQRIDAHLFEECKEGSTAEVAAEEYAFKDLPAELEAGVLRVKFDNMGKEVHELVFVTPKAGVTESLEELLALPEEQAQQKVDAFFAAFQGPDEHTFGVVELQPGDYLAVCFIPQGMTSPDQEIEGPPHFTLGMRQPVKVS